MWFHLSQAIVDGKKSEIAWCSIINNSFFIFSKASCCAKCTLWPGRYFFPFYAVILHDITGIAKIHEAPVIFYGAPVLHAELIIFWVEVCNKRQTFLDSILCT